MTNLQIQEKEDHINKQFLKQENEKMHKNMHDYDYGYLQQESSVQDDGYLQQESSVQDHRYLQQEGSQYEQLPLAGSSSGSLRELHSM